MPQLFPHQIKGAEFLAARQVALLADEQRVGKTAAAIRACDYVMARRILVITKSSARAQWGYDLAEWGFQRNIQVIYTSSDVVSPDAEAVVVGWGMVFNPALLAQLLTRRWDVLLADENHEAKNLNTKRTHAVYGDPADDGLVWTAADALAARATYIWPLTGTPVPNAPNDLYPLLRAQAPERLLAGAGGPGSPDVTTHGAFVGRYCVVRRRRISGQWRDVIKGGKNLEELTTRLVGLWLRRTQKDVGIRPPIFSVFALHADKLPASVVINDNSQAILDAIETGEAVDSDMHLGTIRRVTGVLKAHAVVEAVAEMLEDRDLQKIVLMSWHKEVLDIIETGLSRFGVVGVDGRTPSAKRYDLAKRFREDPIARVFNGQIQAAGEAIDLVIDGVVDPSDFQELWFVEPSFIPKDMSQAALRITNHTQKRQALVRVCALAGSIDEPMMGILTEKVATIRQIMEPQQ